MMSHPVWDEWIEIYGNAIYVVEGFSLIPFGMSGLKYGVGENAKNDEQSHPVWDEWIEILCFSRLACFAQSHPVWDEWIEIGEQLEIISKEGSLIPFGMSGLK